MAEQVIRIVTQAEGRPGVPAGVAQPPSVAGELRTAFGDAVREFGQGLSGIIPTIVGAAVGRITGSFTLGGAAATIATSTVRNIQTGQAAQQLATARRQATVQAGVAGADVSDEAGVAGIAVSSRAASIIPVVGAVLAGALILRQAFSAVAQGLREMEENLAPFSADIAVARAEVNIRQIRARIQRAQEFGPEIAELVRARGELAETVEDIKARLLIDFLPLIIGILRAVEPLARLLGGGAKLLTESIDFVGSNFGIGIDELAKNQIVSSKILRKISDNTTPEVVDVFKEITDFLTDPIIDPAKAQIRLPVGRGIF